MACPRLYHEPVNNAKNYSDDALAVRQGAKLLDEGGQPLKGLKDIQVGDYVRQECEVQQKGPCLATKINILKRAWQVEGSPE